VMVRNASAREPLERLGVEVVLGDIGDVDAQDKLVDGAERVFHIAAMFREANHPDQEYYRVNVVATRDLLTRARDSGVKRFVHCSTIGVHGHVENPPANEDSPFNPGDVYQESKLEGERVALSFAKEGPMEVTVIRPASIYGPGDLRMLKMFRMIAKGRFFLLGSGEATFHPVYIDDLVQAFMKAGEVDGVNGEVFIGGGPRYLSHNEMSAIIARCAGVRERFPHFPVWPFYWLGWLMEMVCIPFGIDPPLHRRRVGFFTKHRAFTIDKARKMLGYDPQVGVEEGMRRTYEWYRDEGLL